MSFKRAGDDHCALRLQKKRRVAELFAEDIPVDEVSQTRSGRFVCLVCPHNPVLDTMPMLSIHRQGKKHLTNMTIKIEKEHDLSELIQKRKQELYTKEANINNTPSDIGGKSVPSNNMSETTPLLAKTRQLTESVMRVGNTNTNKARIQARVNEKPGELFKKNKPFFQSRVELKLSRDFNKDFRKDDNLSSSTLDNPTDSKTGHQMNTCGEKLSKNIHDKQSNKQSKSLFSSAEAKDKNINSQVKSKAVVKASCGLDSSNCYQTNSFSPGDYSSRASDRQQQVTGQDITNTDRSHGENINREKQKRYLELKMSGWILDSNGKWIKDENVEFDSDEEEPVLTT